MDVKTKCTNPTAGLLQFFLIISDTTFKAEIFHEPLHKFYILFLQTDINAVNKVRSHTDIFNAQ